jgi:hypothetical protein
MTIEKSAFREFVTSLPVDALVEVRFTGGVLKNRSGAPVCVPGSTNTIGDGVYTFRGTKTGRGKGGSLLMRLSSLATGEIAFGTPELGSVISLSAMDGPTIGYASESDMPESRPPRPEYASRLKAVCMSLIPLTGPARVKIRSTDARFNGSFHVTAVQRHVGRHGQISMNLTDASGNALELWTYRHSGIIEHLEIEG